MIPDRILETTGVFNEFDPSTQDDAMLYRQLFEPVTRDLRQLASIVSLSEVDPCSNIKQVDVFNAGGEDAAAQVTALMAVFYDARIMINSTTTQGMLEAVGVWHGAARRGGAKHLHNFVRFDTLGIDQMENDHADLVFVEMVGKGDTANAESTIREAVRVAKPGALLLLTASSQDFVPQIQQIALGTGVLIGFGSTGDKGVPLDPKFHKAGPEATHFFAYRVRK